MHPIICKLGPVSIYSYGLMLVLAYTVATFLLIRNSRTQGFDPELIFNLTFIIITSGLIGARIFYIILNIDYYLKSPLEIIMLRRGGFAWFGGLTSGIIAGVIYLKHKREDIYRTFDFLAPYVALAHSIGRIGCLLHGCCYGRQTFSFGLYFMVHNATLIPTQLYSSLALLAIYVFLRMKQSRPHSKGEVCFLYLVIYSAWRFFIEFFRDDSDIFIFSLSLFQVISIVLFVISITALVKAKKSQITK